MKLYYYLNSNLDKKLELSTITCSAINGSTLYYGVLQNVGQVVHFQYDIALKSGTTIDNTVALCKFSKGSHAVDFIIPCILRNAGSGVTKQSFAFINPNGELYPYETDSGYNEMRISGSYCTYY